VAQINSEITQTTVPQSTIEKINRMFEKNIEEFERAKKLFYKVWNDQ
jgi:predicted DNA-binding transcriptional regulator